MTELVGVQNRIGHISDWDGTLRTLKAEYVMKRLAPKDAKDLARKLKEKKNKRYKTIYDKEYPFLTRCRQLVKFVRINRQNDEEFWNLWITHIDPVDINADLWKLFPEWRERYPSRGYKTVPYIIGAGKIMDGGWHDAVSDFNEVFFFSK